MTNRLDRQSFLGENSTAALAALRVGIAGLGGGGSHMAQQLAHVGVGHFLLLDDDRIERTNLNRLVGGTALDVLFWRRKTAIAKRQIKRIDPTSDVRAFPDKWPKYIDSLADCDVIVGCLDTYASRLELEALARRYMIPYIDLGMDVFPIDGRYGICGQVTLSLPGEPCLRCMNVIVDEWVDLEAAKYGASGGAPQVVWSNGVLASLAVGMLVQLVTPWFDGPPTALLEYDGNTQEIVKSPMLKHLQACKHYMSVDNLGDPWFKLA